MSSLFVGSNISGFYRFARPRYPSSAVNAIFSAWKQLSHATEKSFEASLENMKKSGLALDIACGSGQLTDLLSNHFSKVIASDISATQISAAKEEFANCGNMEFRVGDCYNLTCADGAADLITVAQALHWFDVPKFYAEVTRCLKPTGALALLSYGFCTLRCPRNPNEAQANRLLDEYFLGEKYIGPYWDSRRALVDSKYESLPVYNEEKYMRLSQEMTLDLTLSQFVNYMKSQSAYHTYLQTVKPSPEADVLNVFISELTPLIGDTTGATKHGEEPVLPLVFPLSIIVSVK